MTTIPERVLDAFRSIDIDNPELTDNLESDLAMDSQEVISLIFELEKAFAIKLKLGELNREMTISEVVSLVQARTLDISA